LREAISICSKILSRPNLKASERKPFQTQNEKLCLKLVESEKLQQESKSIEKIFYHFIIIDFIF